MEQPQTNEYLINTEQLRLLTLFHYISGGLAIVFSSIFILYLLMISMIVNNPQFKQSTQAQMNGVSPADFISIFIYIFGAIITLGIMYGIAQIIAGNFIKQRKHRLFIIIVAIPNLLFIPYGTLLSIFTLIVLSRPWVVALFNRQDMPLT